MGKINLTAENEGERRVLEYLEQNASDALTEKINNGTKTMAGCWEYIRTQARKLAVKNCAVIEDAEVYGWAVHYFEEDDIPENTPAKQDLRKMAIDAEQREKEIAARNAQKRAEEERKKAEKEEEERKKIEQATKEREEKRRKAAERAEAAAAKAKEREEKATGAVAGQLSLFDLLEG